MDRIVQLFLIWSIALSSTALADVTTTSGTLGDLAEPISSTDLINGLIGTELVGDQAWHPANSDPNDQLPALTDGLGVLGSGLTGLMNDFPASGAPTKRLQYDLGGLTGIQEIRVFSRAGGQDGRVFQSYTVEFSSNGGTTWTDPIYVQSHPSGTHNGGQWEYVLTQLTSSVGGPLDSFANALRFDFYGVDSTLDQARDPFDGVNPFTLTDDGLGAPIVAPAIIEIDVVEVPEPASISVLLSGGLLLLRPRRQ